MSTSMPCSPQSMMLRCLGKLVSGNEIDQVDVHDGNGSRQLVTLLFFSASSLMQVQICIMSSQC
jgi:hypothetical protein